MKSMKAVPILFLAANLAQADCPPPPDHAAALDALISQAQGAATEAEGQRVGQAMWELWADAPDASAQAVLDRGMSKRASYDFFGAMQEFDRLVEYCPDYAEGYNQRAFVNYLRGNFAAAVPDLERALELSPRHIAARAGLALTLMQMGETDRARNTLQTALDQNPWLGERHLMATGGPLAPTDIDL